MTTQNDFDILRSLLERDRSTRRFKTGISIPDDTLKEIVSLTTLCASGRNLQPLRYRLVTDADERDRLFPSLQWAGYYKDWDGPEEHQRPSAYIVQCLDTRLTKALLCDDGLNLQAITLGAIAKGISSCIIKAFNAVAVSEALSLPDCFKPLYVLALGVADEKVRIVPMRQDDDYRYYRDDTDAQCVPKRSLDDILI